MKYILLVLSLIISNKAFSITNSECRKHYLEIINSSPEGDSLTGSEQVTLFLQPSKISEKFLTAKNDSIFLECIKNNNK